jgi:N-acetyl-anhydromuramyl-L-alanine amidase AmpD
MDINLNPMGFIRPLTDRRKTEVIVLHHSASSPSVTIQDVHRWHLANGWSGVGYHFVVYANGEIWTGRPIKKIGAHAYYNAQQEANSNGIGICLIGDFEVGKPTPEQMDSLIYLLHYIWKQYPGLPIKGHKDIMPTACPGKLFPWDELHERLEEEEKVIYKTLADVPDWGQSVINKLVARKTLVGDEKGNLNLSEDLIRTLVILEREGVIK